MKRTMIESRIGTLHLQRGHYYCPYCREGFSPLDQQLRLAGKNWSEGIVKLMVWLSGITDYAQAEEILQKVGQMNVSDSSIWRQAQEWGERFQALGGGAGGEGRNRSVGRALTGTDTERADGGSDGWGHDPHSRGGLERGESGMCI